MKKNNRIKKYKLYEYKDVFFLVTLFFVMVFMITILFSGWNLIRVTNSSQLNGNRSREKVVTTICVEKNSSLWDIASNYYTEEYGDLYNMIEEIKKSNGIEKDMIHEGAYLIIPHYVCSETNIVSKLISNI